MGAHEIFRSDINFFKHFLLLKRVMYNNIIVQ